MLRIQKILQRPLQISKTWCRRKLSKLHLNVKGAETREKAPEKYKCTIEVSNQR
jgi:hypothetical protein